MLHSSHGMGRTTVLRGVQAVEGGVCLGARDVLGVLSAGEPAALEEAFLGLIDRAMDDHDLVIVDDLHLLTAVSQSCDYPRTGLLDMALTAIIEAGARRGKRLLFGSDWEAPRPVHSRSSCAEIPGFGPEDYEALCRHYFTAAQAGRLDYAEIHRFAPELSGHQLKKACLWLRSDKSLDTAGFQAYLAERNLTSNVQLDQVAPVDWKDLQGIDVVIRELELKIALPFENQELAAELQLQPKRGVLLAGPGTGKTTIGRALAAKLKGKFFLIDGTVIAGTNNFYHRVESVFNAAKKNAPSVVFIDDCDLIFESSDGQGFCRYLLTMLDGLESAKAERVCVMITAMNVKSLPHAVLRSGRIELWLETQLPDAQARNAIIGRRLATLPPPLASADIDAIASASAGLTGADLRAVVEDAKLLFAHDRGIGRETRPAEDYFLTAIEALRVNRKTRYGFIGLETQ